MTKYFQGKYLQHTCSYMYTLQSRRKLVAAMFRVHVAIITLDCMHNEGSCCLCICRKSLWKDIVSILIKKWA